MGTLQARILEWVVISSRDLPDPRMAGPSPLASPRIYIHLFSHTLYGVGPKVHLDFSMSCYGKTQMSPLTNPIYLLISHLVASDSLQPYGLQHSSLPCPSLSPGICSHSCALSWWCHPTLSSSVAPFSSLPSIFPSIGVFSSELVLHVRWPQYWKFIFNISPSNEYSGLISFRIDRFDLLAIHGTFKSLLQHHSLKASVL